MSIKQRNSFVRNFQQLLKRKFASYKKVINNSGQTVLDRFVHYV